MADTSTVEVLRAREVRKGGRGFTVTMSVPSLVVRLDARATGALLAVEARTILQRNLRQGLDAHGRGLPGIAQATLDRREQRADQWARRRGSIAEWATRVAQAKAEAIGRRRRTRVPKAAADDRWLVRRFMVGAGFFDQFGASVRNQRSGGAWPPIPGSSTPGVESGLLADNVRVRFAGQKTGEARFAVEFPRQRADYIAWAEGQGARIADVPAEMDARLQEILRRIAQAAVATRPELARLQWHQVLRELGSAAQTGSRWALEIAQWALG